MKMNKSVIKTIRFRKELVKQMEQFSEVNWSEVCRRAIENYIQARGSANPTAKTRFLEKKEKERAKGYAFGLKVAGELAEVLEYDQISKLVNEVYSRTDNLTYPGDEYGVWIDSPPDEYTSDEKMIEQEAKAKGSFSWLLVTYSEKESFHRNWVFIKGMLEALIEVFQ